jgi:predicted TIM-barrel fold metal-dependent hydrolase
VSPVLKCNYCTRGRHLSRSGQLNAAVGEIERVARRRGVRGLEISRRRDMTLLWDQWWNPMWAAIAASGLRVHFRTIGTGCGATSRSRRRWRSLPEPEKS